MRIQALSFFILWFFLWSCGHEPEERNDHPTPFLNVDQEGIGELLQSLSTEEKIGQLIVVRHYGADSVALAHLLGWAQAGKVGGVMAYDLPLPTFLDLRNSIESTALVPLFWGTSEAVALNGQFADAEPMPALATARALHTDSLADRLQHIYFQQLNNFNFNWVRVPRLTSPALLPAGEDLGQDLRTLEVLSTEHMLSIVQPFPGRRVTRQDSVLLPEPMLSEFRALVNAGAAGLWVDSLFLVDALPEPLPESYLKHYLHLKLNFDGLLVATVPADSSLFRLWQAGVDLFVVDDKADVVAAQLGKALAAGVISESDLNSRVRKVLMAKSWMRKQLAVRDANGKESLRTLQASLGNWRNRGAVAANTSRELLEEHLHNNAWRTFSRRLYENALTVAANSHGLLPLNNSRDRRYWLFEYSRQPFKVFQSFAGKYAEVEVMGAAITPQGALAPPAVDEGVAIVLLDELQLDGYRDAGFIQAVQQLGQVGRLVLVNFRDPANLSFFDSTVTVVQLFERNDINESLAAQLLFGALSGGGKLPVQVSKNFPLGKGIVLPVTRLKFALPEEVGIAPEKLVGINAIAQTAIDEEATPGCQILVAKDGKIIFDETFGFHTYEKELPVTSTNLYDLASITKVAATTLAAMKLYDDEAFKLSDRLEEHLPLEEGATIGNIQLRKLFIHQSGLQPHMPVIPYLLFRDRPNDRCDSYFCKEQREPYTVEVARDFYFDHQYLDTIWRQVYHLPVGNQKRFRYSDVNFMLIQRMIEDKTGQMLNLWLDEKFYGPLGLRHCTYLPLDSFALEEIIPTQEDKRWRHQLVHGHVHDETAALLGGVAGHAGLFSTAEDLAVIFQLLLNGGSYGGRQYFSPETVELFTSARHGNHRGLGFDKPYLTNESAVALSASSKTFGHTGFTGGCVWADPEENLIFIFLSNRLHPQRGNGLLFREKTRRRIHQVIYDALDSYQEKIPELPEELVLVGG